MIPAPKLDDRTYADIVAEAMRLIPRYCPEWTNHNPSDPGVTVVELTAWIALANLYARNNIALGVESEGFAAACGLAELPQPPRRQGLASAA